MAVADTSDSARVWPEAHTSIESLLFVVPVVDAVGMPDML